MLWSVKNSSHLFALALTGHEQDNSQETRGECEPAVCECQAVDCWVWEYHKGFNQGWYLNTSSGNSSRDPAGVWGERERERERERIGDGIWACSYIADCSENVKLFCKTYLLCFYVKLLIWKRYIAWEKSNPTRTEDQALMVKRGIYVYICSYRNTFSDVEVLLLVVCERYSSGYMW